MEHGGIVAKTVNAQNKMKQCMKCVMKSGWLVNLSFVNKLVIIT